MILVFDANSKLLSFTKKPRKDKGTSHSWLGAILVTYHCLFCLFSDASNNLNDLAEPNYKHVRLGNKIN